MRMQAQLGGKVMSKTHVVQVRISNQTDSALEYVHAWFDSGRLADNCSWPARIEPGQIGGTQCSERDSFAAGCSGWVQYKTQNADLYFAFSNPSVGRNGIDIGNKTSVWDHMTEHYGCEI